MSAALFSAIDIRMNMYICQEVRSARNILSMYMSMATAVVILTLRKRFISYEYGI